MTYRRSSTRGLTLVEVLIVVTILGILAAIVVPRFSNASETAQENALKSNLFRLRQQIELYKADHGRYPELANFVDQLTLTSDKEGNTASVGTPGYPFGPYITQMPVNPFTDTVPVSDGAAGTSAWYYNETDGHIAPNDSADRRTW